jgi:hypothetical protein
VSSVCVRRAWLVMGTRSLELEDLEAGYACTELNLGFPEVREVTNNRPDADGTDDRTSLMGSRAVSANIGTIAGGTLKPDEIATIFAPYMVPSARPELHYVLDRAGEPERMCVVRASDYGWPITGSRTREIHLSWIAPDPIMRDPVTRSSVSRSGSTTIPGRVYNLTYSPSRIYPVGGGAATTGTITSAGDVAVRPLFRIFGPITDPRLELEVMDPTEPLASYAIAFVAGTRIDAGHWIDVDADRKVVLRDSDPLQSAMAEVDWQTSTWPAIPPSPAVTYFNLYGDSTSAVSQAEAIWTDGYLS